MFLSPLMMVSFRVDSLLTYNTLIEYSTEYCLPATSSSAATKATSSEATKSTATE